MDFTAFKGIETLQRRAGAVMWAGFGSCKGSAPATPRHKVLPGIFSPLPTLTLRTTTVYPRREGPVERLGAERNVAADMTEPGTRSATTT
jgi:hypothetical protein